MPLTERARIRQVRFSAHFAKEMPLAFELFPQLEVVSNELGSFAYTDHPSLLIEFITTVTKNKKSALKLIELDCRNQSLTLGQATIPFVAALETSPRLIFNNLI